MKLNEDTAISTSQVLLVPYDARHVPRYHNWMEDPAIQEATASERLTLEEEYENQESWRASHDKLTFIICQPDASVPDRRAVTASEVDAPEKMIGDINFFLYTLQDDDDEHDTVPNNTPGSTNLPETKPCVGEIDIMIAETKHRGRGLGKTTVATFLHYIMQHLDSILGEYQAGEATGENANNDRQRMELRLLMAKIKADNIGSIALFRRLGFEQEGEVNYFGEVKLVLKDLDRLRENSPEGYTELVYHRPPQ